MSNTFTCELYDTIRHVQHLPKRRCYKVTLEVPVEVGTKIMDFAAMIGGVRPWDESKVLVGGLVLTERGSESEETSDSPEPGKSRFAERVDESKVELGRCPFCGKTLFLSLFRYVDNQELTFCCPFCAKELQRDASEKEEQS